MTDQIRQLRGRMAGVAGFAAILMSMSACGTGSGSDQNAASGSGSAAAGQSGALEASLPAPAGRAGQQAASALTGLRAPEGAAGGGGGAGGGPLVAVGPTGPTGPTGPAGPTGPQGLSGTTDFAEFFALMPADNVATVAVGSAVQFPQDGPQNGSTTRLTASTFQLSTIGTYRVSFVVSVTEAGQLMLRLNGAPVAYTVVGRATGTSEIVGEALITTVAPNAVVEVINPPGNVTALTITPLAGGTHAVSASLIIQRLG